MPMAPKLLSEKLLKTLHIALFFFIASLGMQAIAQSVLLPGDVVIVSANADTQSIDFIPLIDIEEGTEFYFSNGHWDDSTQTLTGSELKVTFQERIPAGTNIHVNNKLNESISVTGNLTFEGGTHRLFAYQKEAETHRFIFALGWGKGHVWNSADSLDQGSDIPLSLREQEDTYLTLGEASNHQYYIRNGASGTRKLLLKFVGDEANWRSSEKSSFPVFGTSFNLLSPPVILFDQSITTVDESDSAATLNVAIYEHDGSRLSVDVVFDSLRSIASTADFNGFNTAKINFTGLIGDGVYEVKVPINDDEEYEGRETGIFTLTNLSKGNFGDFLTHSLVLLDNEQPDILISQVLNTEQKPGFVELTNNENGVVSLSGWTLSSNNQTFTFSENAILYPKETLQWMDTAGEPESDSSENIFYSNLKKPLLSTKGGTLVLKDFNGDVIQEVTYSDNKRVERANAGRQDIVSSDKVRNQNADQEQMGAPTIGSKISVLEAKNPGYKVLAAYPGLEDALSNIEDIELFSWNEQKQIFEVFKPEAAISSVQNIVFGYFEPNEMEQLAEWVSSEVKMKEEASSLDFSVSATDYNENETIDGLEGLNMIMNEMDEPLNPQRFVELIQAEYPEISINPVIYVIRQNSVGELNFVSVNEDEEIAPNAPFWVMLDNLQEPTQISLTREKLMQEVEASDNNEEAVEEQRGLMEFTLATATKSQQEKVTLNFVEEGVTTVIKDLNSYPQLFLPNHFMLAMAFNKGEDYFSELTLSSKMEQGLTLPIHFATTQSGQLNFSVSGWENVPSEWEIKLEDRSAEKEYNLRKDFSITFEHTGPSQSGGSVMQNEQTLSDFSEDDRFFVHITPPNRKVVDEPVEADVPRELELHQNFPNPFNPETTISFYLPESEEIRLSVFNIVGQPVAVIAEGTLSAGEHQFEWDATDKPSGMYIYQLEVGKSVMTRKMTLVK